MCRILAKGVQGCRVWGPLHSTAGPGERPCPPRRLGGAGPSVHPCPTVTLSEFLTTSLVGGAAQESPDVMDGLSRAWQGTGALPGVEPQVPCGPTGLAAPRARKQVSSSLRSRRVSGEEATGWTWPQVSPLRWPSPGATGPSWASVSSPVKS